MTAQNAGTAEQVRAQFDAEVTFLNGGGLSVRGFRLDVPTAELDADQVGLLLVTHLGLLMVDHVQVSALSFLAEAHKGSRGLQAEDPTGSRRLVDLTHPVEDGMVTYPGIPGPQLGTHLSREESRSHYAPGTEFELGTIRMAANTGTYLDAPWHRYAEGTDLAGLPLERVAELEGVVIDVRGSGRRAIDVPALVSTPVRGRAVLLRTGWDRHWRTEQYGRGAPYVTGAGADWLVREGAVLVGIDSLNLDDAEPSSAGERPAHSALLAAQIPVLEHLTGLAQLPPSGFRVHAAPVPVRRFGTFPVRAYAVLRS